ncbi:MAG: hypothetical protein CMG74_08810 [Candidatus Marinimicrobia bacterium]|nr:hypothetical protein [Candidatus Neomarinimicrobiota bacterium]|tara:strand:- start:71699 stop:72217 length:519 start_codon:yes stop_codon:yes gene_type:complete
MKSINKQVLSLIICTSYLFGQFKADIPLQSLPSNLNGELNHMEGLSFFDPDRFNIQHGFSVNMTNFGGRPISMTGYSSNISYWISDNLTLNAKIMLFNSTENFAGQSMNNKHKLYLDYDARVTLKPSKNSFIQLGIVSNNSPYYGVNNYNRFGYSSYQRKIFQSYPRKRIQE